MATTPKLKVAIELADDFGPALLRAKRYIQAMNLGVELAAEMTVFQVEDVLEKLRGNAGHDKSEADARWIAEVTPDFERMVTDGLAWLIATREYLDEIKPQEA